MQGTLLCTLMKQGAQELISQPIRRAGMGADCHITVGGAEAGFPRDGHLPSTQGGSGQEDPRECGIPSAGVSGLSRIFQVSEVVREWREASEGLNALKLCAKYGVFLISLGEDALFPPRLTRSRSTSQRLKYLCIKVFSNFIKLERAEG